MKDKRLVLCDTEEEYAQLMTDFLKGHRELPWQIYTYTEVEGLFMQEKDMPISLLVVAESAYCEEMQKLSAGRVVLLNESGVIRWDKLPNINKYQQAENVLRELLEQYLEIAGDPLPRLEKGGVTRFVGMYSPIRRSLQTSFALTMSQMLSEKYRTLYLNFEHYVGLTELVPDVQTRDMADLLYFLTAGQDKFRLRFRTMLQHRGNLHYIPPMKAGQNLLTVTAGEWLTLLKKLEELGEYDYIILDLSECMQGLFDVLRLCYRIYTLTKEDGIARRKMMQYEQLLQASCYEDILQKTDKLAIPKLHRLPEDITALTKGELAELVRIHVQKLCEE